MLSFSEDLPKCQAFINYKGSMEPWTVDTALAEKVFFLPLERVASYITSILEVIESFEIKNAILPSRSKKADLSIL